MIGDLPGASETFGRCGGYRNTDGVFAAIVIGDPFAGIGVGHDSSLAFADLDGDGILDLVVGARDGTLRVFKSPNAESFVENGTGVAFQRSASDPEGTAIHWSLGRADAALFDIDASRAVTLSVAPDVEAPQDEAGVNATSLTVTMRVTGLKETPGTLNDVCAANEDATVTGNVVAGDAFGGVQDTDPDSGAVLAITKVSELAAGVGVEVKRTYGTLMLNATGSYVTWPMPTCSTPCPRGRCAPTASPTRSRTARTAPTRPSSRSPSSRSTTPARSRAERPRHAGGRQARRGPEGAERQRHASGRRRRRPAFGRRRRRPARRRHWHRHAPGQGGQRRPLRGGGRGRLHHHQGDRHRHDPRLRPEDAIRIIGSRGVNGFEDLTITTSGTTTRVSWTDGALLLANLAQPLVAEDFAFG